MAEELPILYSDGTTECGTFESEIGVRTDDVIVVGWINPAGVILPPAPPAWLTAILPVAGPPVASSFSCNDLIVDLSLNDVTPNGNVLAPADRTYILNWMFKYAGNTDPIVVVPGGEFRDVEDMHIDEFEVASFYNIKTNYKLVSRFQISFLANSGGFKNPPTILHELTRIGDTINPCGPILTFLGVFPGQSGPANGPPAIVGNTKLALINDG